MSRKRRRRIKQGRRIKGRGVGLAAKAAATAAVPLLRRFALPVLTKAVLPGSASAGADAGFRKLFGGKRRRRKRR